MIVIDKKFLDQKVLALHKKGHSAAYIGQYLRDLYLVVPNKRLTVIYPFLKSIAAEREVAEKHFEKLKIHYHSNKKDYKVKNKLSSLAPKIHHLKVQENKQKSKRNEF